MTSLSKNIKKSKDLDKIYFKESKELIEKIIWLKTCEPKILHTYNPDKSMSIRFWNESNYYFFDEIKGFNLLMIRLLKIYLDIRIKLNREIEICLENFRNSLRSYDTEISEYQPMPEYILNHFEQDRHNILRPYEDLKTLKKVINSDKITISIISEEIKKREIDAEKYLSLTLNDLIEENKRFLDYGNPLDL